jgi:hypothetical protein
MLMYCRYSNKKGLLQGCPMSPTLFKIYIDTALKQRSRKCKRKGLKIGDNCCVHNLLFADDQVVITRGVEDANYIGRKLEEEYERWGLKIYYEKTEYRGFTSQWEYNPNCKTIQVFWINSPR